MLISDTSTPSTEGYALCTFSSCVIVDVCPWTYEGVSVSVEGGVGWAFSPVRRRVERRLSGVAFKTTSLYELMMKHSLPFHLIISLHYSPLSPRWSECRGNILSTTWHRAKPWNTPIFPLSIAVPRVCISPTTALSSTECFYVFVSISALYLWFIFRVDYILEFKLHEIMFKDGFVKSVINRVHVIQSLLVRSRSFPTPLFEFSFNGAIYAWHTMNIHWCIML